MTKIEKLYKERANLEKRYDEVMDEIEKECSKITTEKYLGKYLKFDYGVWGTVYVYVKETSDCGEQTSFSHVKLRNNVRYNWIEGPCFHNSINYEDGYEFKKTYRFTISKEEFEGGINIITKDEFFRALKEKLTQINDGFLSWATSI